MSEISSEGKLMWQIILVKYLSLPFFYFYLYKFKYIQDVYKFTMNCSKVYIAILIRKE